MTIQRMDHVGVVVDDLEAAVAFFVELGMERHGTGVGSVDGRWVTRSSDSRASASTSPSSGRRTA
jgi:catechol 2,3-dioxygenase-like lactoylglutathione lyase family enzyme